MKNNQRVLSLKTVAFALTLSGGAALIYEVVSTEVLFYYFNNNIYSVTTVLSTFLLGLALGSLFISKYLNRVKSKPLLFIIFQFTIGLYALFILTNFNLIPCYLSFITGVIPQDSLFLAVFSKFIVGTLYLIIPTFLFGASFPLAASIVIKRVKEAGQNIGVLYSWDLFGSIAGTLVAGFLIMPLAGLKAACFFGGGLNFLSGFLVFKKDKKINLVSGVLIFVIFVSSYFLIDPLKEKKIVVRGEGVNNSSQGVKRGTYQEFEGKDILYQANTPYGVLHVINNKEKNEPTLFINHKFQCNKSFKLQDYLSQFAFNNIEGENLKALIIGYGCGFTTKSFLEDQKITQLDVVEINPKIPPLAKFFFSKEENPLKDKRVNLILEDGFKYLQKNKKKYDIILVDIEDPSVAHSSPLYTVEGFKLAAESLKDKGIFEIQGYNGSYDYLKILYFTLKEAFPYIRFTHQVTHIFLASKSEFKKENLTDEEKDLLKRLEKEKNVILNTMNYPILKYKYGQL